MLEKVLLLIIAITYEAQTVYLTSLILIPTMW